MRSPKEIRSLTRQFLAAIKRDLAGQAFPYVAVFERGGDGQLHAHIMLPDVRSPMIRSSWTHGHVYVERMGDAPARRRVASYLAKDFDKSSEGSHRYEVGQGFQPEKICCAGDDIEEVAAQLVGLIGREPDEMHVVRGLWWRVRAWIMRWNDP